MGDSALLAIRALSKVYGEFEAVTDLDLEVGRGELFALLGPNGAGKTTTLRMLMGILRPTRGTAAIDGHDCFRLAINPAPTSEPIRAGISGASRSLSR
jgi:ABC-2 type transport system ATP-binding protein